MEVTAYSDKVPWPTRDTGSLSSGAHDGMLPSHATWVQQGAHIRGADSKKMLIIILFFVAGIVLGRLLRARQRVVRLADRLTIWSIYLMLFVLGLSVGGNERVLVHIGTLGMQAAVLTLGAIAGSVAAVQLLRLWPASRSDEE